MNPNEMAEYMLCRVTTAVELGVPPPPIILSGQPGSAKTATCRLAYDLIRIWVKATPGYRSRKVNFEAIDMASILPEDMVGLPYNDNGVARYAPMARLAKFMPEKDFGVLTCEDITAAQPAVKVVSYGLFGPDRTVGGHKIGDNILLIATGNRREDKAAAFDLPSPVANRCEFRTDLMPDLKGWTTWALANKVPPIIPAFLDFKREHAIMHPEKADSAGRYPTWRSWTNLGYSLKAMEQAKCLDWGAQAFVGEKVALEFVAFARLRQTLSPAAIFDGEPIPDDLWEDPGKARSLVTALAEEAASRNASDDDLGKAGFTLANLLGSVPEQEFGACGLRHYLKILPQASTILSELSWSGKLKATPAGKLYDDVIESILE